MTGIGRLLNWLRKLGGTELPCGCIASDGRSARFSNATTVLDQDIQTVRSIDYRNCTKYEQEWECTIRCDHCGATWMSRRRSGSKIDYGDENPDAGLELETDRRGRSVSHNEVPVVERDA